MVALVMMAVTGLATTASLCECLERATPLFCSFDWWDLCFP